MCTTKSVDRFLSALCMLAVHYSLKLLSIQMTVSIHQRDVLKMWESDWLSHSFFYYYSLIKHNLMRVDLMGKLFVTFGLKIHQIVSFGLQSLSMSANS